MTDREKLIELLKGAETKVAEALTRPLKLEEWLGIYADYLLANGVIVPPCKVGDIVYTIFEGDIETITIIRSYREETINGFSTAYDARNNFLSLCFSEVSIGKTVFLTKEEAEERLRGLK